MHPEFQPAYDKARDLQKELEELLRRSEIAIAKGTPIQQRMIGEDGYDFHFAADLRFPAEHHLENFGRQLTKWVVRWQDGKLSEIASAAVFTQLQLPRAVEDALHIESEYSIGRVVRAFDPMEAKFVERADFLFRLLW